MSNAKEELDMVENYKKIILSYLQNLSSEIGKVLGDKS